MTQYGKIKKPYRKTIFHPIRIGITLATAVAEYSFWVNGASAPAKFFTLGSAIFIITLVLFTENESWDCEDVKEGG